MTVITKRSRSENVPEVQRCKLFRHFESIIVYLVILTPCNFHVKPFNQISGVNDPLQKEHISRCIGLKWPTAI